MNTLKDRIALASAGMPRGWKAGLAVRCGVSKPSVSDWASGNTASIDANNLFDAADFFGVNPNWLATGIGPMRPESGSVSTPTDEDFTLIPQLDVSASCGAGYFVDHVVVKGGLAFKKSSLRDFGIPESDARIIYASGGSMEPSIQDGCVVLVNTSDREPKDGKIYAICQPDGSLVLKRLVHDFILAVGAHGWIMRSDNQNKTMYPDKMLPPDSRTSIIGRAVWNDNRL